MHFNNLLQYVYYTSYVVNSALLFTKYDRYSTSLNINKDRVIQTPLKNVYFPLNLEIKIEVLF